MAASGAMLLNDGGVLRGGVVAARGWDQAAPAM
jgi:hypothetical protein